MKVLAALYGVWALFIMAEWIADTFFGGPFWPVVCPC